MPLASETTTPFAMAAPLVAFAILLLLTTMAVPLTRYKVRRDQERELRWALREIRTALEDLVREGYLRQIPIDPMTGSAKTWVVIMEDALTSVDQTEPGIYDVRSGSDRISLEGTPYSEW